MSLSLSVILLFVLSPIFLFVVMLLCSFCNGEGIFFLRSQPKGGDGIFEIVGFGAVSSRCASSGGLLDSSRHVAVVKGFLHLASVSRLPRLVGILGKSVSVVKPHPLLIRCLPLCGGRRTHERRVHPKVAK